MFHVSPRIPVPPSISKSIQRRRRGLFLVGNRIPEIASTTATLPQEVISSETYQFRQEKGFCSVNLKPVFYHISEVGGGVFVQYPAQFIRCVKLVRARIAGTGSLRSELIRTRATRHQYDVWDIADGVDWQSSGRERAFYILRAAAYNTWFTICLYITMSNLQLCIVSPKYKCQQ